MWLGAPSISSAVPVLHCGVEHRVEVQVVAVEVTDELIGRVAENVDEWMTNRRQAPARQPTRVLPVIFVE